MTSADSDNSQSQGKVLLGVGIKFDPRLLQELITQEGYFLFLSTNREEIFNTLEEQQYDLVILDFTISEENDFELIDFLYRHHPDIPVILLTPSPTLPLGIRTDFIEKYDFVPVDFDPLYLKNRIVREMKHCRLESALEESRTKFQNLVNHTMDWIWFADKDLVLVYSSPQVQFLIGYEPEEVVGKKPFDFMPAEEAEWVANQFAESIGSGERLPMIESTYFHREGHSIIMETHASPMFDHQGMLTGYIGSNRDITERKQFEKALRKSEERFRAVFQAAEDYIFIKDSSFRYTHTNPTMEKLFNLRTSELIGRTDEYFLGVDAATEIHERDARVLEGEIVEEEQTRIIQGTLKSYHVIKVPLMDDSGEVIGICGIARDITERKRADQEREALQRLSQKLTEPLDIHELGRIIARESRFLFHHDAFSLDLFDQERETIIGIYNEDTFLGKEEPQEVPSVDVPISTMKDSSIFKGKPVLINRQKDPQSPYLSLFGDTRRYSRSLIFCPIRWKDMILGALSVQNYTPNRYSEKDLPLLQTFADHLGGFMARTRAEEALRESEEIYRKAISFANGVPYQRDYRSNKYTFIGEGIFEITGMTSEEFVPSEWESCIQEVVLRGELAGVHPEDAVALTRSGKVQKYLADFQFKTRDGKIRWLTDSAVQLKDAKGQVWGSLGILQDITDRKKAEEEQRKMEMRIQQAQKLESLSTLAGGVAHHFNNLLMAILGNVDLVLQEIPVETPGRECIKEIQVVAQQAAELSNQMLACSGRGKFVVERIDVSKLIEQMAHLLDISIAKPILLRRNLAPNLPKVKADASQLRQLILNLVTNASEAIGQESGAISIATSVMECDSSYLKENYMDEDLPSGLYVCIEISDTGCGMDKTTQARIFDPFFSTKFTGRGLGMAAVLGIVRGHQGTIRIYSEPERGTTARVLLPGEKESIPAIPSEVSPNMPWKGHGKILLVDDEEAILKVGSRMLEKIGFQVLTAANGRDAVKLYEQCGHEIICVILDLSMPQMDGEETFNELRRIREDARIILSSGYHEQEVTERFSGRGLAGFIHKPYQTEMLVEKIREVLEGKGSLD